MKLAFVVLTSLIIVGCASQPETFVAQRGYHSIAYVTPKSDVATIQGSFQPVISDRPTEVIDANSWEVLDDEDVPDPILSPKVTALSSTLDDSWSPKQSAPRHQKAQRPRSKPTHMRKKAMPQVKCEPGKKDEQ